MALPGSVYERGSRGLSVLFSRFVYAPRGVNKPTTRLTSNANDSVNAESYSKNSLFNNLIFKNKFIPAVSDQS